uniref:Uncharacterized protein n=1 Tax=Cryptomonas curvata TaxID=233186 RepID=A0A7S0QNQ3_9CRYP|mmetsp:Transcript_45283/g.94856  ORF Transcript_45283/g.94856 Transcript_45283/m.94856 type:complete len:149 (+) Transcript_45283:527-973(+)
MLPKKNCTLGIWDLGLATDRHQIPRRQSTLTTTMDNRSLKAKSSKYQQAQAKRPFKAQAFTPRPSYLTQVKRSYKSADKVDTQVLQPTSTKAMYGNNPSDRILNTDDHNGNAPSARFDDAPDNDSDYVYDVAAIRIIIHNALALARRI